MKLCTGFLLAIIIIQHLGQMGFGLALHPVLDQLYNRPQMAFTALHYAADKGHSEIVKLLLAAGAATDIHDKV